MTNTLANFSSIFMSEAKIHKPFENRRQQNYFLIRLKAGSLDQVIKNDSVCQRLATYVSFFF